MTEDKLAAAWGILERFVAAAEASEIAMGSDRGGCVHIEQVRKLHDDMANALGLDGGSCADCGATWAPFDYHACPGRPGEDLE